MTDSNADARLARAKRRFLQILVGYITTLALISAVVWIATSSLVWGLGAFLVLLVVMPWVITALRIMVQRRAGTTRR